jgi:capsular polysaccharide biosynthesis protein
MGLSIKYVKKPSVKTLVFGPSRRPAKVQSTAPEPCAPNPKEWPFSNTLPLHIWSRSYKEGGWCVRCKKVRGPDDHFPKMVVPDALKHQVKTAP